MKVRWTWASIPIPPEIDPFYKDVYAKEQAKEMFKSGGLYSQEQLDSWEWIPVPYKDGYKGVFIFQGLDKT